MTTQTVNTATPDYIVDSTLTDGEAWVPLITTVVSGTSTANVQMQSSTGANDWSQYMNLFLISTTRSLGTNSILRLNFNNDTGSNYQCQILGGNGTNDTAYYQTIGYADINSMPISSSAANYFASCITQIFDINSGKDTSLLGTTGKELNGVSAGIVNINSTVWYNQAPVTEIDLSIGGGVDAFAASSRFDLFGILPRMVTV
jgi:hypothetical protein